MSKGRIASLSLASAGAECACGFEENRPHRPYDSTGSLQNGSIANNVNTPAFLPDIPEVKQDIVDYYAEVEHFDREVGDILKFFGS